MEDSLKFKQLKSDPELSAPWHQFVFDNGGEELYDLNTDPGEKINLAAKGGVVKDKLRGKLLEFIRDHERKTGPAPVQSDPSSKEALDSLGY